MEDEGAEVAGTSVVGMDEAAENDPGVKGEISTDNSRRTDHSFVIMRCRRLFCI